MKTALAAVIIFVLFSSLVAGLYTVEVARANFTPLPPDLPVFLIKSDGSVEPPSAPLSRSGDTYCLTGKVFDYTVKIQKDNIILDGAGNTIQASPVNTEGLMIPVGWRPAVHLDKTSNVTVRNVKLQGCYCAIYVQESKNVTITNNTMASNGYGVVMLWSTSTTIAKNHIANGRTGIIFYSSSNNTIVENNILSNVEGVNFRSASTYSNCVKNNNLTANTGHAIFFDGGVVNHTIAQNTISYNRIGIGNELPYYNCTVYSNNFLENSQDVQIGWVEAAWDKDRVGNYWSNYTGADSNGDGTGDTPHVIDSNNQDNYPFMQPINFANTLSPILTPSPSSTIAPTPPTTLPPSPTISPSSSPAQQPTLSPTQTAMVLLTPMEDNLSNLLIVGIVAVAVAVSVVVYFKKVKK